MKLVRVLIYAVLLLSPGGAFAQAVSTAQLSGVVKDATGAVVPGAQVTATQTSTGAVRSTTTGSDGGFELNPLTPGPYRIEIKHDGFTTYVQQGLTLEVGSSATIAPTLAIGAVSEQVVVTAAASLVETQQVGVGQVIDHVRIEELPLNGRQVTQLITLAGATTPAPAGDMNSSKNYPTVTISVAGGAAEGITFLLDGANHNDPFNNLNLPLPMPDALQEFKVETSALPAQYGYHSVGAVNATTRSGTNQFHGVVFDFFRNGALNARDYFATKRDGLKRNQFGGTVGGPVMRDKLFFFGAYQGTVTRTATTTTTQNIPTAAMFTNGFSYTKSGVTTTVTPAQFNQQALNLLKYVPLSTTPSTAGSPFGSLIYVIPNNSTEHQETARVDYVRSPKHTLFSRYFVTRYSNPATFDGVNALTTTKAGNLDYVNSGVIGDTYLFSQNLVNQFRATLNRDTTARTVAPFFSPTDLGVNMAIYVQKYTNLGVTGGLAVGGAATNPGHFNTTTPQVSDDVLWTVHNHQLGFGANYIHAITNTLNTQYPNGQFTFSGSFTGNALYDFMLGDIGTFGQGAPQIVRGRLNYIGLYVDDVWKIRHNVVLSYGVRWDPYLPTYTPNNHDMHFSMADFNNNVKSTQYANAPAGFSFPGDANFPISRASNTNAKRTNFAPRFGVAWDPRGDGRTSVRASYGIFYDLPTMFNESRFALAPPWGATFNFNPPAGGFTSPYATYPGGNPFPGLFNNTGVNALFPVAGAMLTMPTHVRSTYINQYGLSIQQQIGAESLLKLEYIGNTTIHQWAYQELDPSIYLPGNSTGVTGSCGTLTPATGLPAAGSPCSTTTNANARRVLYQANQAQGQYVSTLANLDDGGTGSYNGLLVTLQHRLSHNVSFLANYTWSKCISDPVTHELSGDGAAYSNPANRRFDRGRCPSDYRHVANVSAIFQSPKLGSNAAVRYATGNWQFSPIVSMRSSGFFTVTTGTDSTLNGISNIRANLTGSPYTTAQAAGSKVVPWLNYSSFSVPAAGTFGNPPSVFSIAGPKFLEFDTALSRAFPFHHDKQQIEFRGEAFNILNRVNLNNPSSTLSSGAASFGTITSDSSAPGPRILQLALKIRY
jgi:hypothetical protein